MIQSNNTNDDFHSLSRINFLFLTYFEVVNNVMYIEANNDITVVAGKARR